MVKRYLLVLFCLLLLLVSNAQNQNGKTTESVKYAGQLLDDKTHKPLAFAHVAVLGTKNGAVTNDDGHLGYIPLRSPLFCRY